MLRRIPPVLPVCALIGAVLEPRRGKQENVARRSLAASRTVVLAEGLGGMRSDFHQVRLPVPNVVTDGRRFGPLSGRLADIGGRSLCLLIAAARAASV